jgi:hypothetical protein
MTEKPSTGFPPEIDQALQRYVDEDCPGDVNAYLDALHIEHPQIHESGAFMPEYPVCGDDYHAVMKSYYNKHDGEHWYWTCEPNG